MKKRDRNGKTARRVDRTGRKELKLRLELE
jgi:hypothetical protein